MTQDQRLRLLTDFCMALGNEKILKRDEVEIALNNYFDKLEQKIPLCLLVAKLNEPPPPNWHSIWRQHCRS